MNKEDIQHLMHTAISIARAAGISAKKLAKMMEDTQGSHEYLQEVVNHMKENI